MDYKSLRDLIRASWKVGSRWKPSNAPTAVFMTQVCNKSKTVAQNVGVPSSELSLQAQAKAAGC